MFTARSIRKRLFAVGIPALCGGTTYWIWLLSDAPQKGVYTLLYSIAHAFGLKGADIALSQRLGHGCFQWVPQAPPQWAMLMEGFIVPAMIHLICIFISILTSLLLTKKWMSQKDQFHAIPTTVFEAVCLTPLRSLLIVKVLRGSLLRRTLIALLMGWATCELLTGIMIKVYQWSATTASFENPLLLILLLALGLYCVPLMAGCGIATSLVSRSLAKHWSSYASPHCWHCGYSLQGLDRAICPECGSSITLVQERLIGEATGTCSQP